MFIKHSYKKCLYVFARAEAKRTKNENIQEAKI